jgi:hypothetical protein
MKEGVILELEELIKKRDLICFTLTADPSTTPSYSDGPIASHLNTWPHSRVWPRLKLVAVIEKDFT